MSINGLTSIYFITKCQSFKSYLLEINSEAEQNWLMDKVSTDKWWTGAVKHPQYNDWVWNYSGDGLTYKNWYLNQPNGGNGEECMLSENGLWHDYPCDFRYKIICERGEWDVYLHVSMVMPMLKIWSIVHSECLKRVVHAVGHNIDTSEFSSVYCNIHI